MTEIVYDRSFSTEGTSSVIDRVYYSTTDQKLIVELVNRDYYGNQILAGYDNVPPAVFVAMDATNTNRLNGDQNASVGAYWNHWVKPKFTGFNTDDVELADAGELLNSNQSFFTPQPDEEVQEVGEKPFTVHFAGEDEDVNVITVYAGSVDQALIIFNQIAKIAGWQTVEILAVTQYFI